jgi:hypothetical protein
MDKQQKLEQARKILLHPNFNKLTPEQIQEVYRTILASGLTKDDISNILRSSNSKEISYLESLPYNVFSNLILTGEILGKDLIALCNSSPLINEKCNQSFTGIDGKVIPQFLFYNILKKMGINLDTPDMNETILKIGGYREFYKRVIDNEAFFSLHRKLKLLDKITSLAGSSVLVIPDTVYDVLYNKEDYDLILAYDRFHKGRNLLNKYPEFIRAEDIIDFLYLLRDITIDEYSTPDDKSRSNLKFDLKSLVEFSGQTFIDYQKRMNKFISGESAVKIKDLINVNGIFHSALENFFKGKNIPTQHMRGNIKARWKADIENVIEEIEEEENYDKKIVENLRSLEELSDSEVDYIIQLHERVLSGQLPVLTLFRIEELIKY